MICLVTKQQELFESEVYKVIDELKALEMMKDWNLVQFDSETNGRDAHLCDFLCVQFGNDKTDTRIVVDTTTIDVKLFKEVLETKRVIGHNLKFDLQFLYNYGIKPTKVYDTMIVEQVLYLGYPSNVKSYSLKSVAWERLHTDIDKTVRGEIIWRGLDTNVIVYAAGDVTYLERIMQSQIAECRKKECIKAAQLECDAVPAMAYLEWCGIMLDRDKWKAKMKIDEDNLVKRKESLDSFVINLSKPDFIEVPNPKRQVLGQGELDWLDNKQYHEVLAGVQSLPKKMRVSNPFKQFVSVDPQGDLFTGFDLTPKCTINWDSSKQVIQLCKVLGFDTTVQDKKTGEDKDSVLEKTLKTQKGINDEFLKLYFDYKESSKVVSTYGQGHLNAINPKTQRIHTTFKQIGASSGRMSCGSKQSNTDLAKVLRISPSMCTYPNLQQLPADEPTRSSFVAPEGYLMVSADFSAEESRLGADIYQDKEFIKEFLERSGDMHSMFAWAVFKKECQECGCTSVSDVKKKAPQWRKAVKAVEFAYMFGAAAHTISQAANCSEEQAQAYIDALDKEFTGVSSFAKRGSKFVREHGYILICPYTGHKMYWWDWKEWKERQTSFTQEFWEDYRLHHKGTGDSVALMVREHFQAAGKYDRMARNSVTQGTGAIIMKEAITQLFRWILENNYFGVIHLCCCVHDEIVCDFPKELDFFPKKLESIMEEAAAKYCKTLPIPAEASVDVCWRH